MSIHAANKALTQELWHLLDAPSIDQAAIAERFVPTAPYKAHEPVGNLVGGQAFAEQLWAPLRAACTEFERDTHILMAGRSNGRRDGQGSEGDWVAATGYFNVVTKDALYGIPASNKKLRLRWGEFLKIEDGKIVDAQFQIDLLNWCEQLGIDLLPPSMGAPLVWPAPTAISGIDFPNDPVSTAKSLDLGRGLIFGGLNVFDEENLESMGMAKFFHPNLKWYGPGGINACMSLKELEDLHQAPWLVAFPDRKVQDLESLFAEGPFVAGSGVAGVVATQTGPFRGCEPHGNRLEVSGLDFWLRTDDQFTENWVFVDMIKMFREMGYDLLARLPKG